MSSENPASWQDQLEQLCSRSLLRRLRILSSPQQPEVSLDGRTLVNFSSNDYLGLANHPDLKRAAVEAVEQFGIGSGASRLICGTQSPHILLEERIADLKQTESALSFSSGYAAALGTIPVLAEKGDVVILDKLAHASLIDAARLSGATLRVFPHNEMERLRHHLAWSRDKHPDARVLVVTESIFSMDGDRALLNELVELKDEFDATLFLDDAHAFGILGPDGQGLSAEMGLADRVDIQMGTLSKAVGTSGGYICGPKALIDLLINRARSFIYSTAPPPHLAATAARAIDLIRSEKGERRRRTLWRNVELMSRALNPDTSNPCLSSAILPYVVGKENAALDLAADLAARGYLVPAIRYPTVAKGQARLRITLSASHTESQIAGLATALRDHAQDSVSKISRRSR